MCFYVVECFDVGWVVGDCFVILDEVVIGFCYEDVDVLVFGVEG